MKKPVFGTREWAEVNADICNGCCNNCWYCFAKAEAVRFKKMSAGEWPVAVERNMDRIHALAQKQPKKIMFPAHHDITLDNIEICLEVIKILLEAGHELLIVSKPKVGCITQICHDFTDYTDKILFRFTMGSVRQPVIDLWEPKAPTVLERLNAITLAYNFGFRTSVSAEPLLEDSIFNVALLIMTVKKYVTDSIWIGKMNFPGQRLSLNEAPDEVKAAAKHLAEAHSDIFIKDLYARWKDDPMIRWKESVKKIVGIEVPTEVGLDI
tara:strand:- start:62 stop:862 length:801 start_codon:yes stop_codon:yes gene_type:complete